MRLQLLALLVAGLACLLMSAAVADDGDDGSPAIPLRQNLRLLVRPTLLGLVPPADEEGYGDVFVRLVQVGDEGLTVHYEIKELVADTGGKNAGTRIRRGDIQVSGVEGGLGATPPLFWPDGDWSTDDGLLWLPRESYQQLLADGSCPWRVDCRSGDIDAAADDLSRRVTGGHEASGQSENRGELELNLTEEDQYPCLVNGERTELPARRAVDSQGLAEYWILADEENPLLLKMSLIPPAADQDPSAETSAGLSLLQAGAGYAVVEIDF